MLATIVQNVYIDKTWVAEEYLRCWNTEAWKEENTIESMKCWKLECVIDINLKKITPDKEITLDKFVAETEGEVEVIEGNEYRAV